MVEKDKKSNPKSPNNKVVKLGSSNMSWNKIINGEEDCHTSKSPFKVVAKVESRPYDVWMDLEKLSN